MLTAADDHTIRIWDLKTGRCTRKIEAHVQFVTSMSWGRQVVGTASQSSDKDPNAGPRLVNVIATTGSDQVSVKIAVLRCFKLIFTLLNIKVGEDMGTYTMKCYHYCYVFPLCFAEPYIHTFVYLLELGTGGRPL